MSLNFARRQPRTDSSSPLFPESASPSPFCSDEASAASSNSRRPTFRVQGPLLEPVATRRRSQMSLLKSSSSSNLASIRNVKRRKSFTCADEDLLYRAVRDAGRWASGCVIVEVWVQIGDHIHLPQGGFWMDPVFHHCNHSSDCAICKILDPFHPSYVPAAPLAPGEGLQGYLWSRMGALTSPRARRRVLASSIDWMEHHRPHTKHFSIVWRDIKSMAMDPHQPYSPRLQALARAAVGLATAVPFEVDGHNGMVVYITRKNVDPVRCSDNSQYLRCAAQLVGSAWALRQPRRAAVRQRQQRVENAFRRVKHKFLELLHDGVNLGDYLLHPSDYKKGKRLGGKSSRKNMLEVASGSEGFGEALDVVTEDSAAAWEEWKEAFCAKTKAIWKKSSEGGGLHPEPPVSFEESCFVSVGVFCALLSVTLFNELLQIGLGPGYSMSLGPFGALLTLQFCLTAAPAAQPFHAIFSQFLALTVGLSVATLLRSCHAWIRQSVATTLAISLMSVLGIVHPPAGASAILFASGDLTWTNAVAMLLGNTVAIIVSTIVNNFHDKRQYPTFWGLRYMVDSVMSTISTLYAGIREAVRNTFPERPSLVASDGQESLVKLKPDFGRLKSLRQKEESRSSSPISMLLKKSPSLGVMNNRISPPNVLSRSIVAFGSSNSVAPTEASSTASSVSSSLSAFQGRSFLGSSFVASPLTRNSVNSGGRGVLPRTVEIASLQQQQQQQQQRPSTVSSPLSMPAIPRGGLFDSPFAYGSFVAPPPSVGVAADAMSVATSEGFRDDESFSFM